MANNTKVFSMKETYKLPAILNFTMQNLRTGTGKNAGTMSNQVMAAATAFIASTTSPDNGVERAWTGWT